MWRRKLTLASESGNERERETERAANEKTKELKGRLAQRSGLGFADDERNKSACGRV